MKNKITLYFILVFIGLGTLSMACDKVDSTLCITEKKTAATGIIQVFFSTYYKNSQNVCYEEDELNELDLTDYKLNSCANPAFNIGKTVRSFRIFNLIASHTMAPGSLMNWWILLEPTRGEVFGQNLLSIANVMNQKNEPLSKDSLNTYIESTIDKDTLNWIYISELENLIRIENVNDQCMNMHLVKCLETNEVMLLGCYDVFRDSNSK